MAFPVLVNLLLMSFSDCHESLLMVLLYYLYLMKWIALLLGGRHKSSLRGMSRDHYGTSTLATKLVPNISRARAYYAQKVWKRWRKIWRLSLKSATRKPATVGYDNGAFRL